MLSKYKITCLLFCKVSDILSNNTFGFGLEKVKEIVSNLFPNKSILQVDSDILSTVEDYEKAIIDIEDGNVDPVRGFPKRTIKGVKQHRYQ